METIPKLFENRTHNLEFYAQKRVYGTLKLLNKLPVVQNVSGEFTNYVSTDAKDVLKLQQELKDMGEDEEFEFECEDDDFDDDFEYEYEEEDWDEESEE